MYNAPRNNQQHQNSEPKKNNFLGKLRPVELFGIGLFLLATTMFLLSKCLRDKEPIADSNKTEIKKSEENKEPEDEKTSALRRRLYVCMDSVKMRRGPGKDSSMMKMLSYGDELIDLGEYENEQTIRIAADNVVTEPWVKVKTIGGETGWVFGGALRPYLKKKPEPKKVRKADSENTEDSSSEKDKKDTKSTKDKKSTADKKSSVKSSEDR